MFAAFQAFFPICLLLGIAIATDSRAATPARIALLEFAGDYELVQLSVSSGSPCPSGITATPGGGKVTFVGGTVNDEVEPGKREKKCAFGYGRHRLKNWTWFEARTALRYRKLMYAHRFGEECLDLTHFACARRGMKEQTWSISEDRTQLKIDSKGTFDADNFTCIYKRVD